MNDDARHALAMSNGQQVRGGRGAPGDGAVKRGCSVVVWGSAKGMRPSTGAWEGDQKMRCFVVDTHMHVGPFDYSNESKARSWLPGWDVGIGCSSAASRWRVSSRRQLMGFQRGHII